MTKKTERYEVQRTGRTWGVFRVTRDERGMWGPQSIIEGGFFDRRAAQECADELTADRIADEILDEQ